MARAWDHDPPAKRKWTPLGVLVLASGALTLMCGEGDSSDYWADGLKMWWGLVKGQYGHIKRLVIYLDNGPNNAGNRTQWRRRMVEFCDWSGLEVRRVYYPAYHSKYNPIEHCWGVLEQTWGGALLSGLKVIPQQARRMTWCGRAAAVKRLRGDYPSGVKLSRSQMKPYEARLERSATLPKYDITIKPRQGARQVG
jgi:hypothetical protein